jgi:hypothetical protein
VRPCAALAVIGSTLAFSVGGASAASAADDVLAPAPTGPPVQASLQEPVQVPAAQPIPATGTAIALAEDGDMLLACNGTLHRFDVHGGGQLTVGGRIPAPDGTPGVVMTTTSENLVGYDRQLGMVTVAERTPAAGELRSPVPGKAFPAAGSFAQNVTVSFEHSPCDSSGAPATFRSKAPFALLNTNITDFPPNNDVYTLLDQVELESVDAPTPTTMQLLQFPVTVNRAS